MTQEQTWWAVFDKDYQNIVSNIKKTKLEAIEDFIQCASLEVWLNKQAEGYLCEEVTVGVKL